MSYLIILLIVAVVVGPVMWMMPSAKQKQQIRIRDYAMRQGLQIKIADLPQSHKQMVRKESPVQGVVYRLPLTSDKPITLKTISCLKKVEQGYEWQGQPQQELQSLFEDVLAQCPESAMGLELSGAGVACYWQERGGEAAVDQIKSALEKFRAQIKEQLML